jgi:ketosteroid isomerase-like protein
MSRENVEIVKRMHPGAETDLVALSRDAAAWAAVMASAAPLLEPAFELEVIGGLEDRPIYTGLSGFREFWLDWLTPWETYRDELEDTLDLGDQVVLLGCHRGTRERTGPEVPAAFAAIYSLRDGKVFRIQYYADRAEALKAVGLAE